MHSNRIITFCLFIILAAIGAIPTRAQSNATSLAPATQGQSKPLEFPVTTQPKHKKHKQGIFSPKAKRASYKNDARYEFYQRIEDAAKEKQRIIKELSKRQYSDRRYFGHKRIPKRRPPHKMRYCGECGIRH